MKKSTLLVLLLFPVGSIAQDSKITVKDGPDELLIDTDCLQAKVRKKGYVSGIAAGSFLDKKTGVRDAGFGLHIMDFLLAPGWRDDGYSRDQKHHGNLAKHYVEGPQICTQAKELKPEIIEGQGFVAVRLRFRFTAPGKGFKAGSLWEQTLVFQPGVRYVLCSEQITSANDVDNLLYRIDMPGHIRHKDGDTFANIYLSYHGTTADGTVAAGMIKAAEFSKDFAPDERFLYQRREGKVPERFIRAYQLTKDGRPGPWLAGMTLDPAAVAEAWCHQRGYVCFIEELHGKSVKAGETFGAAYVVGYFDDVAGMEKTYDRYKGTKGIAVDKSGFRLTRSFPPPAAQSTSQALEESLANLNEQLRADPNRAEAYHERGCIHFKLGNFKESVRDFDKYIELKPERKAGHWQRGISYYYAGQYEDGRKQFEGYQDFDSNDVENGVWRFMCMAKAGDIAKARKGMLKIGNDSRVPMREVYELYKGTLKPADVFAAAQAGRPDPAALSRRLFYAHLYVGIYYELEGDDRRALEHLDKAATDYRIEHYMGDVARVQRDLLRKRLKKSEGG
jgi:hypothetical protein